MRSTIFMGLALGSMLTACGGTATGEDDWGATRQALDAPSRWTMVADGQLESAHPYANDQLSTLHFAASEEGRALKLVISRLDLEEGYDYLVVVDGDREQAFTGSLRNEELMIESGAFDLWFLTDGSVVDWGYQIAVMEAEPERASLYKEVTLAQLVADPAAYDGENIRVVAEPELGNTACTLMMCSPENACCNRCNTGFKIGGFVALESATEAELGCHGDSCDPTGTCAPFADPKNPGEHLFSGSFRHEARGRATLRVDRIASLDEAYVQVDTARLRSDAKQFDQKRIAWTGMLDAEPTRCTLRMCSPDNACCNRCSTRLSIGATMLWSEPDEALTCTGNSCDPMGQCPLDIGQPQTLKGVFWLDAEGQSHLALESGHIDR